MASTVDWERDTHALVRFLDEDVTSIVPVQRVQRKETLEYGGSCSVVWSNKKIYKAFLICSGSKRLCVAKQDEMDDDEAEPEFTCENPNKRQRQDANRKDDSRAQKKTKVSSSSGDAIKTKKTTDSKKKSKNDESNFVLHIGPAPPSLTPATESSITVATTSSVTPATTSSEILAIPSSETPAITLSMTLTTTSSMALVTASSVTPATISPAVPGITSPTIMAIDSSAVSLSEDLYHSDDTDNDTTDNGQEGSLHQKVHSVMVTDGPPNRNREPKHYFSKQDYTTEQLEIIRDEIKIYNETQKAWMETQFTEIKKQLQLIMASGIATTLGPILGHSSTANELQGPITPVVPSVTYSNSIVSTPVTSPAVSMDTPSNPIAVSTPVPSLAVTSDTPSNPIAVSTPVPSLAVTSDTPSNPIAVSTPVPSLAVTSDTPSNPIAVSTPVPSLAVTSNTPSNLIAVSTPVSSLAVTSDTHSNSIIVSTPMTSPALSMVSTSNASASHDLPEPFDVVNGEVTVVPMEELIPHSEMVSFFTKGRNRSHFAALLVEHLINEETRVKSNVRGWKKEQLDPTIIEWVKTKSFEYHPSEGNFKAEWQKCIKAIDSKNRGVKRKQNYRGE